MTRVIAFDVNETLLDLRALDDTFQQLLGSAALRPQWFAQMLQLAFVGGLTGRYVDFTTAQHAALTMLAARNGRTLTSSETTETVERMRSLPPHPEVPGALAALRTSPLTVVALTNSPHDVAEAQLTHAGIRQHFDGVLSADAVRSLKPAREPYASVARTFGVAMEEVMLVAAHSWDVSGALAAGCTAAFVARPGMVPSPIGPQPDIVGADVAEVVNLILAREV